MAQVLGLSCSSRLKCWWSSSCTGSPSSATTRSAPAGTLGEAAGDSGPQLGSGVSGVPVVGSAGTPEGGERWCSLACCSRRAQRTRYEVNASGAAPGESASGSSCPRSVSEVLVVPVDGPADTPDKAPMVFVAQVLRVVSVSHCKANTSGARWGRTLATAACS